MPAICVRQLTKTYRVPVREEGLGAAVRSLVRRRFRDVEAVQGIDFDVDAGEVVGFIGPNGAGKTTTLKMLAGVLHPTSGQLDVLGFVPRRREHDYLRRIAMVRGSKPLPVPQELTVLDALRFQQVVYDVPDSEFARNLDELTALLALEPLLQRQARALSLGERMRASLAWSLLYRPSVLFLDEPTVGLDVSAALTLRKFLAGYAAQTGATILLTSHSTADVESLCRRVILIDHGTLLYDGGLADLVTRIAPYKLLRVVAAEPVTDWAVYGEVLESGNGAALLRVHREQAPSVVARLLREVAVADLSVQEPPLETVMDRVYREGSSLWTGEAEHA